MKISDIFNKFLNNGFIKISNNQKNDLSFSVTEFLGNTDFNNLVKSNRYIDQYIGWTYKAVSFKADAAARQELRLYRQTTSKKADQLDWDKEKILIDLYKFNRTQTLYEARYLFHLFYGLTGIAYMWVNEGIRGIGADFYVLNPERIKVKTNKSGLPEKYIFTSVDGNTIEIPASDMLVMRNPDPKNWLKGKSPVEASKYAINSWEYSMIYNIKSFFNSGLFGLFFFEGIGKAERKRMERAMQNNWTGPQNAKKTPIIGGKKKPEFIPIGKDQNEMNFIEGIRLMREEILSIHGVPSVLVNADGKYNNVKEAERIFGKYTIDPILKREADMYTEQLLPRYYGVDSIQAKKMWFEFESAIQTDPKEQADTAKILIDSKIITINEARAMNGLDAIEGGDNFANIQDATNQQPNNDTQQEEQEE